MFCQWPSKISLSLHMSILSKSSTVVSSQQSKSYSWKLIATLCAIASVEHKNNQHSVRKYSNKSCVLIDLLISTILPLRRKIL